MTYSYYPITKLTDIQPSDTVYYVSLNLRQGVNPLTVSIDDESCITLTAAMPTKSGNDSIELKHYHLPDQYSSEFLVRADNIDPKDIFYVKISGDYKDLHRKVLDAFER